MTKNNTPFDRGELFENCRLECNREQFDMMEVQGMCYKCHGEITKEVYMRHQKRHTYSLEDEEWIEDHAEDMNNKPNLDQVEYLCKGCDTACDDCSCMMEEEVKR